MGRERWHCTTQCTYIKPAALSIVRLACGIELIIACCFRVSVNISSMAPYIFNYNKRLSIPGFNCQCKFGDSSSRYLCGPKRLEELYLETRVPLSINLIQYFVEWELYVLEGVDQTRPIGKLDPSIFDRTRARGHMPVTAHLVASLRLKISAQTH